METPIHDAPEVLREEILADARKEAEQVICRAQEQAKVLLEKAGAEVQKIREERLYQARAEAARRTASILATIPVEEGRLRSCRLEALLGSVREEVHSQLEARVHYDYEQAVTQLAAEAVSRMTGNAFTVKLSRNDAAKFGDGLAQRILNHLQGRSPSITINADDTITGGGVIIQDSEGRQMWDNRFSSRLERLWPELRRQTALRTGLVASTDPPRIAV